MSELKKRFVYAMAILITTTFLFYGCTPNTSIETNAPTVSATAIQTAPAVSATTSATTTAPRETATANNTPVYGKGDATLKHAISKDDCIGPFKGKNVTVSAPIYTGIPADAVYSYKDFFPCLDGVILFRVAFEDGAQTIALDKTGARVENPKRTLKVGDYLPDPWFVEMPWGTQYLKGDGVFIKQTGEPGNYKQQLFNLNNEAISDFFDSIEYFYNGIALIEKNQKYGLISDTGEVLLEPCIPIDTLVYVYEIKEKPFYAPYMFEDAFVLPVGGEFAIFTITRE